MKIQVSVVIPTYNEEQNIPLLYQRLKNTLKKTVSSYEMIFVNDGSIDNSLERISILVKKDKNVKLISFSRNFGHMAAVSAGLAHAHGEKVVLMDADLQDPPEVIEKLYKKSLEGFDVVYGVKKNRKEGIIKKAMFNLFYKILNAVSAYKMPLNAGTFSLMDRKIVDILVSLPEKNKYLSGLRSWTGFSQTGVVYERQARNAGDASSLKKLTKLAMDGLISFSYIPLRMASILGFITASVALVAIFVVAALRIFWGVGIIGWASTMSTILLVSGAQLITLGIIGEYLARIYDEVKNRPEYIIAQKKGF
ncbi:MAG: glycosyltransferase family 2 protein [Patescibacteria group bacterium]